MNMKCPSLFLVFVFVLQSILSDMYVATPYVFLCFLFPTLNFYLYVSLYFKCILWTSLGFSGGSDGKVSACNAGDPGLIHELGRSPG